jgi:predicted unusual protein kinase regulating ubiquinone biosynthesis (AarF/ABC1/UbiB family)
MGEASSRPARPRAPGRRGRARSAVPRTVIGRAGRLGLGAVRSSLRLALIGPRTLLGRDSPRRLLADLHASTAQELVEILGRLKGASMKVGQLASFIDAGVLPPEVRDVYQSVLGALRDAAPPMPPRLVEQVFREEFGAPPEDLYASFDRRPAAAASLGQVHHARLADGRAVAVKVQYPGIERAIRSDLAMTAAVRPLLPLLAPGLEADEAMAEIRERVLEECDYLAEAATLATLAGHYEEHPFAWVPRPVPERTTRRVLTMERAAGRSFEAVRRLPQAERDRVGEILFRFYYGSLHRYGVTSADPHPGNYFLMADGRLALFDFGLAVRLERDMRPHMHAAFRALWEGDVEGLFRESVAMRYVTRPEEVDPERLFAWVRLALAPIAEDRPYRFTRAWIAERTATMMDPTNPWWGLVRRLNVPRWGVLLSRLELGLFAVLAQLGATANWHRITKEFYGDARPSTPLGRAEAAWLRRRASREDLAAPGPGRRAPGRPGGRAPRQGGGRPPR